MPTEPESPASPVTPDVPTPPGTVPARAVTLRSLSAGLDRLQTDIVQHDPAWRRWSRSVVPPVVLLILLFVVWQVYTVIAQPRPDLYPGPLDVLASLGDAWRLGRVQDAVVTSLGRGVIGFCIAALVGTPIGLLLAEVRPLRRAVGPFVLGMQVLPSVSWVPAAIVWFGLTNATVYAVILLGAVPSIINGLLAGVDQVPPQLRRVGRVLGASRFATACSIVLPAALPAYLAGLKQGWAFSWRALMAAEIIATGGTIGFGLGALLNQARQLLDLSGVFVAILLILAVGVLIELVFFGPLERALLRRRGLGAAA